MITWNRVKNFFRGIDIAIMRSEVDKTIILDDPQVVWRGGDSIYDRVSSDRPQEVMPPPPYSPWTQGQIDQFGEWRDEPRAVLVDPDLQETARPFVALSELLTGFSDLIADPVLALRYLSRLLERDDLALGVESLIQQHTDLSTDEFISDVLEGPDPEPKRVAQAILMLWYTGAFVNEKGFATDFGGEDSQYTHGLVWQAMAAHPMGYSAEGGRYWQRAPEEDGRYTGLGNTAPRPQQPAATAEKL